MCNVVVVVVLPATGARAPRAASPARSPQTPATWTAAKRRDGAPPLTGADPRHDALHSDGVVAPPREADPVHGAARADPPRKRVRCDSTAQAPALQPGAHNKLRLAIRSSTRRERHEPAAVRVE